MHRKFSVHVLRAWPIRPNYRALHPASHPHRHHTASVGSTVPAHLQGMSEASTAVKRQRQAACHWRHYATPPHDLGTIPDGSPVAQGQASAVGRRAQAPRTCSPDAVVRHLQVPSVSAPTAEVFLPKQPQRPIHVAAVGAVRHWSRQRAWAWRVNEGAAAGMGSHPARQGWWKGDVTAATGPRGTIQ